MKKHLEVDIEVALQEQAEYTEHELAAREQPRKSAGARGVSAETA